MPRRVDDDWTDEEAGWDDEEDESTDDEPTISCPYCQREIHEDSQRCPHCERYISREDARPIRKAWWIVIGAIVCLYVIYRWVVG